jgi:hypothetical protein
MNQSPHPLAQQLNSQLKASETFNEVEKGWADDASKALKLLH